MKSLNGLRKRLDNLKKFAHRGWKWQITINVFQRDSSGSFLILSRPIDGATAGVYMPGGRGAVTVQLTSRRRRIFSTASFSFHSVDDVTADIHRVAGRQVAAAGVKVARRVVRSSPPLLRRTPATCTKPVHPTTQLDNGKPRKSPNIHTKLDQYHAQLADWSWRTSGS